jgi:CRISPR-associated protein Csb2
MPTLRLSLDAGRYHATPWGRHVNEGAIEWPPSPWRLYRALLATGHRKLGWGLLPETARKLFEKLCGQTPIWWLPQATSAHTRHYMPDFRGETDRVIDAFAFTAREPLYAELPVLLPPAEDDLLTELVRKLSYLGRAESWVSGEMVEGPPDASSHCRVQAGPRPQEDGLVREPVELLGVQSPDDYLLWRQQQLDADLELELRVELEKAKAKGKTIAKSASKKSRERLEALLPRSVVDSLYAETSDLQGQGWSQPPGTQWVTYWLPSQALSKRTTRARPHGKEGPVQAILFALSSNTAKGEVLPPFKDALLRGELFHAAAIARAEETVPAVLTGKLADEPMQGHRHVHYIPLCLNETRHAHRPSRRRIDHILAWSRDPLEPAALRALARVTRIFHGKIPEIFVSVVGTGMLEDFRLNDRRGIPELGRSRVWVSRTPFVPPRYLKLRSRNSLGGQVVAELESRGFPVPKSIDVEIEDGPRRSWVSVDRFWEIWRRRGAAIVFHETEESVSERGAAPTLAHDWRHFRRQRLDTNREPPVAVGVGLRIVFETEVSGPISIGYGSHYGLGLLSVASL